MRVSVVLPFGQHLVVSHLQLIIWRKVKLYLFSHTLIHIYLKPVSHIPGCPGTCYMLLWLKTEVRKNLGEDMVCLVYRVQSIIQGSQVRNSRQASRGRNRSEGYGNDATIYIVMTFDLLTIEMVSCNPGWAWIDLHSWGWPCTLASISQVPRITRTCHMPSYEVGFHICLLLSRLNIG